MTNADTPAAITERVRNRHAAARRRLDKVLADIDAADASRAAFRAQVDRDYGGNVFALLPQIDADPFTDETPARQAPGLDAVAFDADGWPID